MSAQLSRCVAVYSRHFVASRINAGPAVVVAVVFTLDHIVTTQRTIGWTIRYDTRCYFNVRSKANMSQLNLPHGTDN